MTNPRPAYSCPLGHKIVRDPCCYCARMSHEPKQVVLRRKYKQRGAPSDGITPSITSIWERESVDTLQRRPRTYFDEDAIRQGVERTRRDAELRRQYEDVGYVGRVGR